MGDKVLRWMVWLGIAVSWVMLAGVVVCFVGGFVDPRLIPVGMGIAVVNLALVKLLVQPLGHYVDRVTGGARG